MCDYHKGRMDCPNWKPFVHVCERCKRTYCSNVESTFICGDCYRLDEYEVGLL